VRDNSQAICSFTIRVAEPNGEANKLRGEGASCIRDFLRFVARPRTMTRSLLIPFLAAFAMGCSTRSVWDGYSTKPVREVSTEEFRAIEIARKAVTAREGKNGCSWADSATYRVQRKTYGWSVHVWKTRRDLFGRPCGYPVHDDRWVTIDDHGMVTAYSREH
jgi:hypothetical protein